MEIKKNFHAGNFGRQILSLAKSFVSPLSHPFFVLFCFYFLFVCCFVCMGFFGGRGGGCSRKKKIKNWKIFAIENALYLVNI